MSVEIGKIELSDRTVLDMVHVVEGFRQVVQELRKTIKLLEERMELLESNQDYVLGFRRTPDSNNNMPFS